MSTSEMIKIKRERFNLTVKEFADAIGLGTDGYKKIKKWEDGTLAPDNKELYLIKKFAKNRPYAKRNNNPDFRFIDLFAGIGGIRIPFQELGGECVFSSEWDSFSQKTYKANFDETPSGDITKIATEEIPDFDILLAGFPCQPFSQAGLHKGFNDTRGTMFFEIERIIEGKRPKAFLLENVKQLLGHDKGNTFTVIKEHLEALDYFVDFKVLRAADFGVPQNRERVYIVGLNKRHYKVPGYYKFPFPEPTLKTTRLGSILEKEVDPKYTISDALWLGHKRRKIENKKKGNGFGFSLFNEDSPYTNTISARYYKDGSEILVEQKGKNPRKLTPLECSRLQGFPEDFIIPVSNLQAYKQFGNSVAVPVVRAVAEKIIEEMRKMRTF